MRARARARRERLDRDTPKVNGVWFKVHGERVRRHTKASLIIARGIEPLMWWPGGASKYAFRIEDKLRRAGLLK